MLTEKETQERARPADRKNERVFTDASGLYLEVSPQRFEALVLKNIWRWERESLGTWRYTLQ